MKPLVYLAGPYAKPDPVQNTHEVCLLATRLVKDGVVTPVVPHTSLLWHIVSPQPPEFWYAYDLEVMARCDGVLRIPGESVGADAEVQEAIRLRIPVFQMVERLYEFARSPRFDPVCRTEFGEGQVCCLARGHEGKHDPGPA